MYAPMKMGFPTGMAGGGITQFLQPLQEYLSQQVVQQQVQPFITEVSDEAQERFNLGGTGSNDIFSNDIFDNNMFQGNSGGIGTLPSNDLLPAIKDAQALYGGNEPMPGIAPDPRPLMNGFPSPNEPMQPAVPDIDQGFFDSDEYLNFMSKPQIGTQDIYMSRYFGQMGSGSLGGMQEKAYEDYLRRTGQTDKIMDTNPFAPTVGMLSTQPTQLPGPRLPTFTGTGNDGFGSASQGPLDFYNPSVGPMYGPEGTYSLTGGPRPVSQDPYQRTLFSGAVNQ
jgi:hypothetical protein